MSLSVAKIPDPTLTLSGIGMSSERLPPSLTRRMEDLSADICKLLHTSGFEVSPLDIKDHEVTLYFEGFKKSVCVVRQKEVMSSSIFGQFAQRGQAFLRRFRGRNLEETVQEFARTWEETHRYAENITQKKSAGVVRADLSLVPEMETGMWSTAVGYYAPRMAVAGDVASLLKNWIKAVIGSKATGALLLGYVGQVFGLISSSSNFEKAIARKSHAIEIGDADGAVQALSLQVSSATGFTLSSLGVLKEVFTHYPMAVTAISKTFSVLVPFATLLGLTRSIYRLEADQEVTQGLFNYTRNPQLDDAEKLQGALKHLKQQLFVTEKERVGLSEEEVAKLALKKKEVFQRTVGSESVSLIHESEIDVWIGQIQAGNAELILAAGVLVDTVEMAMEHAQFKDQVYVAVSIASLIALAAIYASTGGIPFAILAINAAVNLMIDTGHLELLNSVVVPVVERLGVKDLVPVLSRQRSGSFLHRDVQRPLNLADRVIS